MDIELTVKLEQEILEKAKQYARENKTSLSSLVENYLKNIIGQVEEKEQITPTVKSLSGIIEMSEGSHSKTDYTNFLENKYK